MMSQVRLQSHVGGGRGAEQYQISPELQQEIRQVNIIKLNVMLSGKPATWWKFDIVSF